MPRFEPFPAIRYAPSLDLAAVTSPPYDVIDGAGRDALAASHPANAVHVDCPVGDLGGGSTDAGGADCYEQAAATFRRWIDDGTLVVDDHPSFTLYRMSYDGRSTTGVLGALGIGDGVLPHERTTPKAASDRLDLLRATQANLSAVWGLSLASGLSKLLEPPGPPLGAFTDPDGVRHETWRLDDPSAVAAIAEAAGGAAVVLADGHHRYQTCATYRDELESAPGVPGADATLCYLVELADEQLAVRPIHRLLAGLPDGFDLVDALGSHFDVVAGDEVPTLVMPDGTRQLVPRSSSAPSAPSAPDSALLDEALAGFPSHRLTYQPSADEVAAAVADGRAQAGVLLRPVTVSQIAAVAEAGDRMPPKTTFFWPKPRTGIAFRSLRAEPLSGGARPGLG